MIAQYADFFVVRRVTDGDTIFGDLDMGFHFKWTDKYVRFADFDAEEIGDSDEERRKMAEKARDWLASKLPPGTRATVKTSKEQDKYGRILGHVYINDEAESLNVQMVHLGFQKRPRP